MLDAFVAGHFFAVVASSCLPPLIGSWENVEGGFCAIISGVYVEFEISRDNVLLSIVPSGLSASRFVSHVLKA